jgi:hypothetical protein
MHSDPGALDDWKTGAHANLLHNVTVTGRNHAGTVTAAGDAFKLDRGSIAARRDFGKNDLFFLIRGPLPLVVQF